MSIVSKLISKTSEKVNTVTKSIRSMYLIAPLALGITSCSILNNANRPYDSIYDDVSSEIISDTTAVNQKNKESDLKLEDRLFYSNNVFNPSYTYDYDYDGILNFNDPMPFTFGPFLDINGNGVVDFMDMRVGFFNPCLDEFFDYYQFHQNSWLYGNNYFDMNFGFGFDSYFGNWMFYDGWFEYHNHSHHNVYVPNNSNNTFYGHRKSPNTNSGNIKENNSNNNSVVKNRNYTRSRTNSAATSSGNIKKTLEDKSNSSVVPASKSRVVKKDTKYTTPTNARKYVPTYTEPNRNNQRAPYNNSRTNFDPTPVKKDSYAPSQNRSNLNKSNSGSNYNSGSNSGSGYSTKSSNNNSGSNAAPVKNPGTRKK